MLKKQIREVYYDPEYKLNEFEYKEFNFPRVDPYWQTRAMLYTYAMNCFGPKELLMRRVEMLLFNNFLHKKVSDEQTLSVADAEIELMVRNSCCSSGKFDHLDPSELLKSVENDQRNSGIPQNPSLPWEMPWEAIPELAKMNKRITYKDVLRGVGRLTRPTMCFYDHCKDGEALTGVVAFPFTPKMLESCSAECIVAMTKALGMKYSEGENEKKTTNVDICKQKLLDMWYFVEDSERLHGICPCQTSLKECRQNASQLCPNQMCRICCQNEPARKPCVLHDSHDQFFRHKTRILDAFEKKKGFDRSRTLRLSMRKMIRLYDIERVFKPFGIVTLFSSRVLRSNQRGLNSEGMG